MVDQSSQFVARKYAVACLHIFSDKVKADDVRHLREMSAYLQMNHSTIFLLGMPVITMEKKRQFMLKLARRFSLEHVIGRLIELLMHDKRLFLLAEILKIMSLLYREQMHVLEFSIASYPKASHADLEEIKEFLAHLTGCAIIYTDYEDKNLIAGIRMESTTYLWEYSIAQQLRNVAKRTLR